MTKEVEVLNTQGADATKNPFVKELHSPESKLPVAIEVVLAKPAQHDAYQFAGNIDDRFSFGMDSSSTARSLREIADKIENGEYLVQSGYVLTYAMLDEYPMSVVQLKFHAKRVK